MASIISAGTTSGTALNMAGDTSGVLQLATNGSTTALTIDTSQNVGIGTASPTALLNVNRTTSGSANAIVISRSTTNTNDSQSISWQATDLSLNYASIGAAATSTTGTLTFSTASGGTNTERMRIDSSGNVLVNTSSNIANILTSDNTAGYAYYISLATGAGYGLCVTAKNDLGAYFNRQGNTDGNMVSFRRNGTGVGSISLTASATSYLTSSDYRLKENISPMVGALDTVAALKPVTYKWKVDGSDGQGFIAHELQEVIPDCVSGQKDAVNKDGSIDPQGIDTSFLVATLTAAIQEQQTIINDLKARITALEGAA